MRFFKNKLAATIVVLSVTFLGIIIFSVKKNPNNIFSGGVGMALNPVQKLAYKISHKSKEAMEFINTFSDVKKENEELKKKNIELENMLVEYDDYKKTNEDLRAVLDFKESAEEKYKYIGTNIIGVSGGSFLNGYIIDKGTKDGVGKEMVVIAAEGLVGQVSEAGPNWAKVQTLVNENIAVHSTVKSTDETGGIVKGYKNFDGNLLAKIDFLSMNSQIKEGDQILTSGLGGVYPAGIRIGEVISVEDNKVQFNKNAILKPYVEFNKLRDLFVIVYDENGKYSKR